MSRSYTANFAGELELGELAERIVANAALDAGLTVRRIRPEYVEDRDAVKAGALADECDLQIGRQLLEVKGRELRFDDPATFPYETAFVGRASRWDSRKTLPCALCLVSLVTEEVVVVPMRSRPRWTLEERFDRVTRRTETSYAVAREELRTWEELAEWLRTNHGIIE